MKPKVKTAKRTCVACPTQYEGQLEDGRWFYIRYRWGGLSVGIGHTFDEAVRDTSNYNSFYLDHGDAFAGVMEHEDIVRLTPLDWDKAEVELK